MVVSEEVAVSIEGEEEEEEIVEEV